MVRLCVFGVPVSITPGFWVMGLVLGLPLMWRSSHPVVMMMTWQVILLTSVLGHELGHAVSARRMGASATIRLHAMGGVTSWSMLGLVNPFSRIVIALAGSLVGLGMGVVVWAVVNVFPHLVKEPSVDRAATLFITANVLWGLMNWLPIRPLDGGQVLTAFLESVLGRRGRVLADLAFPVLTVGIGYLAWVNGYPVGVLLAVFALLSEFDHRRRDRQTTSVRSGR